MPEKEKSLRAYLEAFHNRLIHHAEECLVKVVVDEFGKGAFADGGFALADFPVNYLKLKKSQPLLVMGHFYDTECFPDVVLLKKTNIGKVGTWCPIILVEATKMGIVEVRDSKFIELAEKFAAVWEKEREILVPLLQQEIAGKVGIEFSAMPYPALWQVGSFITIIEAWEVELTAEIPPGE